MLPREDGAEGEMDRWIGADGALPRIEGAAGARDGAEPREIARERVGAGAERVVGAGSGER